MPAINAPTKVARQRLLLLPLAAAGAALLALAPSAGASLLPNSAPTAKSVISAVKTAIGSETSVRFTVQTTDKSTKQVESVVDDAGKTNGLQSLVMGKAEAYLRLTKAAVYISGNSTGLTTILGLPQADVKIVGTKWILVKSGTTQYTDLAYASLIGTLAASILPSSTDKVSVGSQTVNGDAATSLMWSETESGTTVKLALDVAAKGKELPLKLTATTTTGSSVTSFGRWDEKFSVTVPSSTIPIAKITG